MAKKSELAKIKKEVKTLSLFLQNDKEEIRFERPVQFESKRYVIKD